MAVVASLGACQSTPAPPPSPSPASPSTAVLRSQWRCGELQVQADFDTGDADTVRLAFDGQERVLPHALSASGARYADAGGSEFWTKGREGTLTLAGQAPRACTRVDGPWDEAASRGVRFRAVGNEPGWLVEIGAGATPSLHAQLDYGQRTIDVAKTRVSGDRYRGLTADGSEVELLIEHRTCQDPMSGENFPAAARLSVGGQHYSGCGRSLPE